MMHPEIDELRRACVTPFEKGLWGNMYIEQLESHQ